MKDCCSVNINENNSCIRKKDNKIFNLPRLYKRNYCLSLKKPIKGFTKRSDIVLHINFVKKQKKQKNIKQQGGNNSKIY